MKRKNPNLPDKRSALLFAFIRLLFVGENLTNKFSYNFSKALEEGAGIIIMGRKKTLTPQGGKREERNENAESKEKKGEASRCAFFYIISRAIYARFRGACMRNRKRLFMGLCANAPAALMRGGLFFLV